MPLKMKPPAGKPVTTKKVTPDSLESTGPNAEWFEINDYLDTKVQDDARKAATTTITQGKNTREEFDRVAFWRALIVKQLVNWRAGVVPGMPFDATTMDDENGVYWWKFLPANVAVLQDDVCLWLAGEILTCGGFIPTEGLVVPTDSGQVLDFPSTDAGVDQGGVQPVPDPIGDAVVQ